RGARAAFRLLRLRALRRLGALHRRAAFCRSGLGGLLRGGLLDRGDAEHGAVAARRASRSGLRVVLVPARPLAQGELRRGIDGREVERERAALARRALEVDLAAEEAG